MTIEIPIEVLQRTWARELQREAIAALTVEKFHS